MNIRILLRLLHTLEELRKHETWTRQQLAQYQAVALGQLRQYAYQKSPFYQSFHKGLMDRPLLKKRARVYTRLISIFYPVVLNGAW